MILRERIPFSTITTLKVGGEARYVAECSSVSDIEEAIAFAKKEGIPFMALGQGSNLLAPDEGYEGVVLHMRIPGIEFDGTTLVAGAGVIWDQLVVQAGLRGLWGIENLAAIPGTMGAAPVQNIGAYGAELADTLLWVEVFDTQTRKTARLAKAECGLGYRESRFKHEPNLVITQVALSLTDTGAPRIAYKDLLARQEAGEPLTTPKEIAGVVRDVRSRKFPDLAVQGTAGSFFKNPTISEAAYAALKEQYPELPGFPNDAGVKVPLAWILDHVLNLRDYRMGHASLFVRQPLVLVTESGASASDVDALANYVATRVHDATSITIEREVRSITR